MFYDESVVFLIEFVIDGDICFKKGLDFIVGGVFFNESEVTEDAGSVGVDDE